METNKQKTAVAVDTNKAKSTNKSTSKTQLSSDQAKAFQQLQQFLSSDVGDMFLLRGFAGTGKTFLTRYLVQWILQKFPKYKIAVTAPTNKAVKVLIRSNDIQPGRRVAFQTVHKLLGLTEEITNDGQQIFTQKSGDKKKIDEYDVLIVDEVSMLDDDLFHKIEPYRWKELKIIFMGDPAQIPPVNRPDCIPFNSELHSKYRITESVLSQIMRQTNDNPIIETSFRIRQNLQQENPTDNLTTTLNLKQQGVVRLDMSQQQDRDQVLPLLTQYFKNPKFQANADYCKVIAWRNQTVNTFNQTIRQILFGDNIGKIVIGEKLIVNRPIVVAKIIVFATSDEFEVKQLKVETEVHTGPQGVVRLKVYNTEILYQDLRGRPLTREIQILHESSQQDFDRIANHLKQQAIKLKGKAWIDYYDFIRQYADVSYGYAITGHKSQGSTYNNVFVLEDDIGANRNVYERNRIKYTVYSRPVDKLFVLKS